MLYHDDHSRSPIMHVALNKPHQRLAHTDAYRSTFTLLPACTWPRLVFSRVSWTVRTIAKLFNICPLSPLPTRKRQLLNQRHIYLPPSIDTQIIYCNKRIWHQSYLHNIKLDHELPCRSRAHGCDSKTCPVDGDASSCANDHQACL